jgi:putative transposase
LERDEHARVKRATVQRQGSKWYVSFTVGHSPKRRRVRQPRVAVGVDVGIRQLATLSTGEQVQNLRPLQASLRELGRLQRRLTASAAPTTQAITTSAAARDRDGASG